MLVERLSLSFDLRKSAFIFALFYLFSVVGYGLEVHYCLGQITDVNVAWLETSCACEESTSTVTHSCCDEKSFFVQISEEHQAASDVTVEQFHPALSQTLKWSDATLKHIETLELVAFLDRGPPIENRIYQQNCALIFYD